MEKLFLTILGMSGASAAAILIVLVIRLNLRRAPKVFSYALWGVVLFRLLCPVAIRSGFSLIPAVLTPNQSGQIPAMHVPANEYQPDQPTLILPEEQSTTPNGIVPDWRGSFTCKLACGIWLMGSAVLLVYSAVSLLRLRRKLIGVVPAMGEKGVFLADHIPSPFVLGLFRPKIYLPSDLSERERDYILLHERTHIRRGDHFFRALAWLAAAIHWFNPLVWLAFYLAGKDMEMSCDEAVLRRMGRDIRADYSASLLRLSVEGKLLAGPLAFGGGDSKSRIHNILSYKKPTLWVMAAALIVVLITGAALSTNRTVDKPDLDPTATFSAPSGSGSVAVSDSLDAGLSFSINEQGNVELTGTVQNLTLRGGAIWYPEENPKYSNAYLTMAYPPFDGLKGAITAWWTDDSRTSVTMSTRLMAAVSSYSASGYWVFTVDLDSGTVTEMISKPLLGEFPGLEMYLYPESISNQEAVPAALIAAQLLTAAEDYYNNTVH